MYAIPTVYRGKQMRSRAEAKWAAFFDACRWEWEYEPYDLGGYVPDFVILGKHPVLVEVKPAVTDMDFATEAGILHQRLNGSWNGDVLIVGVAPRLKFPNDIYPRLGLMFEGVSDFGWGQGWAEGLLHECLECRSVALHHQQGCFVSRPCGHYDGNNLLGPIDEARVKHAWAAACNVSQWNPPAAAEATVVH